MQVYLVGGAVRDKLLGLEIYDKDWVVVGSTPEAMLAAGYVAVGKDFPVFLHPENKQEHALARTERKVGQGYTGFECYFDPEVTLEEDLLRRDLTINAMAMDHTGTVFDPYHGQDDINKRLLRHVSEAFVEDPLRVLRVARFAAKLGELDFQVAPETQQLMTTIAASGELNTLTAERVWQEWFKALGTPKPERFLQVLHDSHGLDTVLPIMASLWNDADKQQRAIAAIQMATTLNAPLTVRFATLLVELGLGDSDLNQDPEETKQAIQTLCEQVRIPNEFRDLAQLTAQVFPLFTTRSSWSAESLIHSFNLIDAWRKTDRFDEILLACRCRWASESNNSEAQEPAHSTSPQRTQQPQPQQKSQLLRQLFDVAQTVEVQAVIQDGFKGPAIRDEMNRRRIQAIAKQLG